MVCYGLYTCMPIHTSIYLSVFRCQRCFLLFCHLFIFYLKESETKKTLSLSVPQMVDARCKQVCRMNTLKHTLLGRRILKELTNIPAIFHWAMYFKLLFYFHVFHSVFLSLFSTNWPSAPLRFPGISMVVCVLAPVILLLLFHFFLPSAPHHFSLFCSSRSCAGGEGGIPSAMLYETLKGFSLSQFSS